jgi:hypothetical protein
MLVRNQTRRRKKSYQHDGVKKLNMTVLKNIKHGGVEKST